MDSKMLLFLLGNYGYDDDEEQYQNFKFEHIDVHDC